MALPPHFPLPPRATPHHSRTNGTRSMVLSPRQPGRRGGEEAAGGGGSSRAGGGKDKERASNSAALAEQREREELLSLLRELTRYVSVQDAMRSLDTVCQDLKKAIKKLDKLLRLTRVCVCVCVPHVSSRHNV